MTAEGHIFRAKFRPSDDALLGVRRNNSFVKVRIRELRFDALGTPTYLVVGNGIYCVVPETDITETPVFIEDLDLENSG